MNSPTRRYHLDYANNISPTTSLLGPVNWFCHKLGWKSSDVYVFGDNSYTETGNVGSNLLKLSNFKVSNFTRIFHSHSDHTKVFIKL